MDQIVDLSYLGTLDGSLGTFSFPPSLPVQLLILTSLTFLSSWHLTFLFLSNLFSIPLVLLLSTMSVWASKLLRPQWHRKLLKMLVWPPRALIPVYLLKSCLILIDNKHYSCNLCMTGHWVISSKVGWFFQFACHHSLPAILFRT